MIAIFLIYTAVKLIIDEIRDAEETDPTDMLVIKWLRKVVHVTPRYHGDKLTLDLGGAMVARRITAKNAPRVAKFRPSTGKLRISFAETVEEGTES